MVPKMFYIMALEKGEHLQLRQMSLVRFVLILRIDITEPRFYQFYVLVLVSHANFVSYVLK